jgi:ornithine cyclodeaminase/alanine dehydrogenase-like protein (mu-crystallin family)
LPDWDAGAPVMFNPMGMAVFDIAVASLFYKLEADNRKINR